MPLQQEEEASDQVQVFFTIYLPIDELESDAFSLSNLGTTLVTS